MKKCYFVKEVTKALIDNLSFPIPLEDFEKLIREACKNYPTHISKITSRFQMAVFIVNHSNRAITKSTPSEDLLYLDNEGMLHLYEGQSFIQVKRKESKKITLPNIIQPLQFGYLRKKLKTAVSSAIRQQGKVEIDYVFEDSTGIYKADMVIHKEDKEQEQFVHIAIFILTDRSEFAYIEYVSRISKRMGFKVLIILPKSQDHTLTNCVKEIADLTWYYTINIDLTD